MRIKGFLLQMQILLGINNEMSSFLFLPSSPQRHKQNEWGEGDRWLSWRLRNLDA